MLASKIHSVEGRDAFLKHFGRSNCVNSSDQRASLQANSGWLAARFQLYLPIGRVPHVVSECGVKPMGLKVGLINDIQPIHAAQLIPADTVQQIAGRVLEPAC
jgi:hypothetical protein